MQTKLTNCKGFCKNMVIMKGLHVFREPNIMCHVPVLALINPDPTNLKYVICKGLVNGTLELWQLCIDFDIVKLMPDFTRWSILQTPCQASRAREV